MQLCCLTSCQSTNQQNVATYTKQAVLPSNHYPKTLKEKRCIEKVANGTEKKTDERRRKGEKQKETMFFFISERIITGTYDQTKISNQN